MVSWQVVPGDNNLARDRDERLKLATCWKVVRYNR
jgi:hypothetical protein